MYQEYYYYNAILAVHICIEQYHQEITDVKSSLDHWNSELKQGQKFVLINSVGSKERALVKVWALITGNMAGISMCCSDIATFDRFMDIRVCG